MYMSSASSTSGRINYVTRRTAMALHQLCRAPQLLTSGHNGSVSTTLCATARLLVGRPHWLSQCVRSLRLAVRLLVVRIAPALLRLCRASGRTVSTLDFSSIGRTGSRRVPGHSVVRRDYLSRSRNRYISTTPRVRVPRHVARLVASLVVDYFAYAARPGASARRAACHTACHSPRRRLLLLRRASGCLGTSRGSSRGSSSTTSPTSRVWVPRHIARLVVWLVVDYSVSCRLIVDYFAYTARPGASTRRAARCVARRRLLHLAQACRRLLRLRRATGCLGTSRGWSSTTSLTPRLRVPRHVARLVVDFFAYATRPVASACHVAHRRLLCLRHTSGCLGTSRGSSRDSSSTTPCAATSSCGHTGSTSSTPRAAVTSSSGRIASTIHLD
jgi:hypothetical protein